MIAKRLACGSILALFMATAARPPAATLLPVQASDDHEVIAIVNGHPITRADLKKDVVCDHNLERIQPQLGIWLMISRGIPGLTGQEFEALLAEAERSTWPRCNNAAAAN